MTPGELADELAIDAKVLRRWLRATWPPAAPGARWDLTEEQVQAARERFAGVQAPLARAIEAPTVVTAPTAAGVPQPSTAPAEDLDALAVWSSWLPFAQAAPSAPTLPGVYMAREGEHGPVVYVGMAGERRGQGVRGRLGIYTTGKGMVSGLGEAAADRALADAAFVRQRLTQIEDGQPARAKDWARLAMIRADLWVRWATVETREEALLLETRTIRALRDCSLWNRLV